MENLEEINKNQKIFVNSMKTIEEKAQEYADNCCSRKGEQITLKDSDVNEYIKDAFNECAGVMQRWISVEEELPSIENGYFNKEVLVKRYKDFERTEIENRITKYTREGWEDYSRIISWRPINFT